MNALVRWFSAASGVVLVLLGGCGSGSAPPPSAQGSSSPGSTLAGNWLIVGPMPTNGLNPSSGFRLALTFDVTGDRVVAGGFANDVCNSSAEASFSFGAVAAGTIAADGSFTAQTPPGNLTEIQIKGVAPVANGMPWSGSYAMSFNTSVPQTCDTSPSGTFTATSFPLVNGVYTGTATAAASIGSSCTFTSTGTICTPPTASGTPATPAMTLQVTLHQGGTATDVRGNTITGNTVLTGSIKVQGSPCFTSGTTGSAGLSAVLGNRISADFVMDDGSTLSFLGSLTDDSEAKIATTLVTIRGGQCGGSPIPAFYFLPELDRQM